MAMTMLAERRIFPRYLLSFPVATRIESLGGAKVFDCSALNISRNNLVIRGDGDLLAAFLAQSEYPHTCEVNFCLPGHSYEFTVKCQLITHRRLSQHLFNFVLGFNTFYEDSSDMLVEYLTGLRAPES